MSTVSVSVAVQALPEQLFTHVATLWESGTGLNGNDAGPCVPPSARLGRGFRLRCGGRRWILPADTELEVRDYVESEGWKAISQPDGTLTWTVRVVPLQRRAALVCVLHYAPNGIKGWLQEQLLGRHLRKRALRRLLDRWRIAVERQEGLRRLRAAIAEPAPESPGGPGRNQ